MQYKLMNKNNDDELRWIEQQAQTIIKDMLTLIYVDWSVTTLNPLTDSMNNIDHVYSTMLQWITVLGIYVDVHWPTQINHGFPEWWESSRCSRGSLSPTPNNNTCSSTYQSVKLLKFVDDLILNGPISGKDESVYMWETDYPVSRCIRTTWS